MRKHKSYRKKNPDANYTYSAVRATGTRRRRVGLVLEAPTERRLKALRPGPKPFQNGRVRRERHVPENITREEAMRVRNEKTYAKEIRQKLGVQKKGLAR